MTPRHEMPTPGPAKDIAACFNALVPLVKTERLMLRGPRLSDFPALAEIAAGPRSVYIGGPMERDTAWSEFAGMVANWYLHGHGAWTIEDAATCQVLGFVLLGLEPGNNEVELGYVLTEAAEGKGIASEAVAAVRDWAAAELNLTDLVSYIDRGNARSIRLAERLNAKRDPTAEDLVGDNTTYVYRHPAPEARH